MARKKKVKPWTYVKRKKKALAVGLGLTVAKGALSALGGFAAKAAAKGAGMVTNPKMKAYPRPLPVRVKRLRAKRVAAAMASNPKKKAKKKSYATPPWLMRARTVVHSKLEREGLQPKKYEVAHLQPTGRVTVKPFTERGSAERFLKSHPGGSLTLLVKDRQDRLRSVPYPSKHTGTAARTFFMGKLLANKPKFKRTRIASPKEYDKKSFRTITPGSGRHKMVVGCPKGKFKRGRCAVGMEVQSVLRKISANVPAYAKRFRLGWSFDTKAEAVKARKVLQADLGQRFHYKVAPVTIAGERKFGLFIKVNVPYLKKLAGNPRCSDSVESAKRARPKKNPGVDYHAKYRTLSDQDLGAYAFTARSVEEARAKALAEGKRRRAWGCWLTRKGNVRGEHLVVSNPGPAYHKREAKRYAKLLSGDLKAKHKDAAEYWQGALSAEAAAVAAGKTKKNPLLMVVPNVTKKREAWQRAFTRILMRKYAGTVKILNLKKVFDHADRLYAEGKSPTAAVAAVGRMTVKSLMNPAACKNWTGKHHARYAKTLEAAAVEMEKQGRGRMAHTYDSMAYAHRQAAKRAPRSVSRNPVPSAALSVVMNRGDDMQSLMRDPRFKKAVELYRKFHGCDPQSISRRLIPVGGKSMVGREFFVSLGKAPSEAYTPHRRSKKAGNIYVHPYDRKPEKVVSADGKTIITLPGSHKVTDWIRG